MKLLFVNNVSSLVGGTAQCSLSMSHAFPDADITVLALSGKFTDADKQLFGNNVALVTGKSVTQLLNEQSFDVIVYQNQSLANLPIHPPHGTISVYAAHSVHSAIKHVPNHVQRYFCVSEFLKSKLKVDWPVLYQPCQKPTPYRSVGSEWCKQQRVAGRLVIGKLCTPSNRKWLLSDWTASLLAVDQDGGYDKSFHFVGATDEAKEWIKTNIKSPYCWSDASPEARGYLCEWDVLLQQTTIEETYGRTICEAQRAGCVPVVSHIGGFVEQIAHGVDGYLCRHTEEIATCCHAASLCCDTHKNNCVKSGDDRGSLANFRKRFLEFLST